MKKTKAGLHDLLFKEVFSQPKYSLDILKLVFSAEEMDLFNWPSLKTEANSFIDEELREKRMDLLLSALLKHSKKRAKVLFLMEHKSQYDPELMRQFLMYQTGSYRETRDPVIPVLINQSPSKHWRGPKDFQGFLQNWTNELQKHFKDNVINFRPRVLNIQALDMKKGGVDLTTRPILYILKHIWRLDESKVRELFTISRGLGEKDREALVLRAMDYVKRYDPYFTWKIIKEIESQTIKEEEVTMPLLQVSLDEAKQEGWNLGRIEGMQTGIKKGKEEGMEKGRQEGMEKGQQQLILKLLERGMDLQSICKYTGFSEDEINKLKNSSSC